MSSKKKAPATQKKKKSVKPQDNFRLPQELINRPLPEFGADDAWADSRQERMRVSGGWPTIF